MIITDHDFTIAMEAVVKERGADFRYPFGADGWAFDGDDQCRYVRSDVDEPACIVGAALAKCGVSLAAMRPYEGYSAQKLLDKFCDMSDVAIDAACDAQSVQDRGHSWGHALVVFHEELHSAI